MKFLTKKYILTTIMYVQLFLAGLSISFLINEFVSLKNAMLIKLSSEVVSNSILAFGCFLGALGCFYELYLSKPKSDQKTP